jgi:hypothetical protein
MTNNEKFWKAINTLKSNVELTFFGQITSEEDFNKIKWKTGVDENGITIDTLINPHPELTWSAVNTEMDRVQAEYDSQDYARKREGEYPKIGDQLDKIYHEGIDAWKADMITPIKNKYPKE